MQKNLLTVAGGLAAIGLTIAFSNGVFAEEAKKEEKPAAAEQAADNAKKEQKDFVLIKYQGKELKKSEVEKEISMAMPGAQPMDFGAFPPQIQDNIVRNIISQRILLEEAKKTGIEDSEELKNRLEQIKKQLVMDMYLREKSKTLVKDEDIKKLYDSKVKEMSTKEEVKASHILVDNEKDAKEVAKKVKGGADFAEVAKEKSKDPSSGANGGDLGYFTQDQMVKEFSAAAFKMKVGEVSQPVKTEFGWHVIKVTDKRKAQPPSVEEMKPQLTSELQGKIVGQYLNDIFDKAGVEVLDPEGKSRKVASTPQAQPANKKEAN